MIKNILKIKNLLPVATVAVAVSLIVGCSDTEDIYEDYFLDLSATSYTLAADGSETYKINVDSSDPNWETDVQAEWLNIVSQDAESITFSADANEDTEIREGKVVFSIKNVSRTFTFTQSGVYYDPGTDPSEMDDRYHVIRKITTAYMSVGGSYVFYTESREDSKIAGILVETATGESTEFDCTDAGQVQGVADNGVVLFVKSYYKDGSFHVLVIPAGYDACMAKSISSDGSVIVGDCGLSSDSANKAKPVRWDNGTPTILALPAKTLFADDPNLAYVAGISPSEIPIVAGASALGCSADGSVIYGEVFCTNTAGSTSMYGGRAAIYWDAQGNVDYVGRDVAKLNLVKITLPPPFPPMEVDFPIPAYATLGDMSVMTGFKNQFSMSPNGKYLTANFTEFTIVSLLTFEFKFEYTAVAFDVENKATTILTDLADSRGVTASDDGSVFAVSPYMYVMATMPSGATYNMVDGTYNTLERYLQDKVGLKISPSIVYRVASNGNVLGADKIISGGSPYDRYWYATK